MADKAPQPLRSGSPAAPAPAAAPNTAPAYAPGAPQPNVPTPSVAGAQDPITNTDVGWLRQHAASLMQELVGVLPDVARQRVQSIPLAIDDTPGEVNAF